MTNTKKAVLTLGTIALVAAPIATVVSCGNSKTSSKTDAKKSSQTELQKKEFSKTKQQVETLTHNLKVLTDKLNALTSSQKKTIEQIKKQIKDDLTTTKAEIKKELEAKIAIDKQELTEKIEAQKKQIEALKGSLTEDKRKKLDKEILEAKKKSIEAEIERKKTFAQTKEVVAEINKLKSELQGVLVKLYGDIFNKTSSKKIIENYKKQLKLKTGKEELKKFEERVKAEEEDKKYISLITTKINEEKGRETAAKFQKTRTENLNKMYK